MADEEDTVEISDSLEKIALYAFDEAKQKLEEAGEFTPFTIMLEGENLYIETHPGDTPEECNLSASKTIVSAQQAIESYVFCYDGFVDLDDGEHDAIIAEAAEREDETAHALCVLYDQTDAGYEFDGGANYLGETDSLFNSDISAGISAVKAASAPQVEEVEEVEVTEEADGSETIEVVDEVVVEEDADKPQA